MFEEHLKHIKQILEENKIVEAVFLGSAGSGKTMLLERTLMGLDLRCAVIICGSVPEIDAEHLKNLCAACVKVSIKNRHWLEVPDIEKSLLQLPVDRLDMVFVEGSGGLFPLNNETLGEDHRILLSDYAAGSDQPQTPPDIFSSSEVIALAKVDLKAAIDFDEAAFWDETARLNPRARRMRLSSVSGEGLSYWLKMFYDWCDAKKGILSEQ